MTGGESGSCPCRCTQYVPRNRVQVSCRVVEKIEGVPSAMALRELGMKGMGNGGMDIEMD